jgi:hypothetical protein
MVLSGLIAGQLLFSTPVIAPGTDLPDLTIWPQNITISPTTPMVGEPTTISATIWNVGTADATNVTVKFYEEDTSIGITNIYHSQVSGYWVSKTIDSIDNAGSYSSIAVDSENGMHISYADYTNAKLKYAYKPSGGSWTIHTVDATVGVGSYSSIAIDGANGVHISYLDYGNNDLKYAYKPNGGSWTNYTVDSTGLVGKYSSIAVDGANDVHISYYDDWPNYDLKYAYKPSGGGWTNYTIDSDAVGVYSSIAVDGTNGVHISYYDANNTGLKYAYKPSGGSWTTHIVDSTGVVGGYSSIAVDGANGVHIGYTDSSNQDLKYAYKPSGGSWTNYTIDSPGDKGTWTSIAIDGADGVHISYYDGEDRNLKYAYKQSGENWTTRIVDSPGDVGVGTSIAVDGSNGVHISYRDEGNSDLKYANQIIPPGNVDVAIPWTPTTPGLRNITVKIDENNKIEELDETNNNATVSINVEVGPLASIVVVPQSAALELNETQQFNATGYDAYNNDVPISPTWDSNSGGTIDQSGLFTANYPGTWSVYANQSDISGVATVIVQVNETADTDSDDMLDWWEIEYNLDPFNGSDANLDPDLDGLINIQEFLNSSHPHNNDTDGDNLGDGFEVIFSKTKPEKWDTNGNGIGDGLEFIQSKGYLGWIESLPNDWIGMTITWDNYTVLVKTNSSVLEGEFDKDEQKLKIKVSGPDGTQGITEIDVPKSLCEPDDIEIMLDGEMINYTITEDDTYYYIHIEYNHSIHELSADFSKIVEEPREPEADEKGLLANLYLIALIIAVIIILLLSIVVIRNRSESEDIGVQELDPEKLSILLDKKHDEGKITDETYNDAKTLLEKYRGDEGK